MSKTIDFSPIPADQSQSGVGTPREIQAILDALRGLRFGSVEIIVQDSRIVQIDRREKRRLVGTGR